MWIFNKTALLIFQFWRSPLAPTDALLFKDAEFAITWKSKVTQVTALRFDSTSYAFTFSPMKVGCKWYFIIVNLHDSQPPNSKLAK